MKSKLYVLDGRVIHVGDWDCQWDPVYRMDPVLDEGGRPVLSDEGEQRFMRVETGELTLRNPVPESAFVIEDGEYAITADGQIVLASDYASLRRPEYPPFTDYLDAVVKDDAAAIEAYRKACLAVKAHYPKDSVA
jgi:hypothetical protein